MYYVHIQTMPELLAPMRRIDIRGWLGPSKILTCFFYDLKDDPSNMEVRRDADFKRWSFWSQFFYSDGQIPHCHAERHHHARRSRTRIETERGDRDAD